MGSAGWGEGKGVGVILQYMNLFPIMVNPEVAAAEEFHFLKIFSRNIYGKCNFKLKGVESIL